MKKIILGLIAASFLAAPLFASDAGMLKPYSRGRQLFYEKKYEEALYTFLEAYIQDGSNRHLLNYMEECLHRMNEPPDTLMTILETRRRSGAPGKLKVAPEQRPAPSKEVPLNDGEDSKTKHVAAQVMQIDKIGGRADKVIINLGSGGGMQVGMSGVILDGHQRPVAGIVIAQVDANLSLAKVVGLSREITLDSTAKITVEDDEVK